MTHKCKYCNEEVIDAGTTTNMQGKAIYMVRCPEGCNYYVPRKKDFDGSRQVQLIM